MNFEPFLIDFAEIFHVKADQLTEDFPLSKIEWDSLGIIQTLALVDEHFNISIDGSRLAKCERFGDVLKSIKQCMGD